VRQFQGMTIACAIPNARSTQANDEHLQINRIDALVNGLMRFSAV
jgi:hypothetical protein